MKKTITFTVIIIMLILTPVEAKSGFWDLSFCFTSGFFSFSNKNFREMYGMLPSVNFSMEFFHRKNYGFNLGLVCISGKGQALILSGESDQIFQLNFSRISLPLSFRFRLVKGKFEAYAGVGGVFSFVRERWPDAGLSHKERRFHPSFESGVTCCLIRNLGVRLGLVYESIFSNHNSPALYGAQPNLGGFSFQVGVAYRFKLK